MRKNDEGVFRPFASIENIPRDWNEELRILGILWIYRSDGSLDWFYQSD